MNMVEVTFKHTPKRCNTLMGLAAKHGFRFTGGGEKGGQYELHGATEEATSAFAFQEEVIALAFVTAVEIAR
jgi:hypothetical protein